MTQKRYLVDASVLISAINSRDVNHLPCYSFFKNNEDVTWVIPTLAYFEFQATQSRLRREGKKAIREVYIPNVERYEISLELAKRSAELGLFDKFDSLKGADLVYACIAAVEQIPLVTSDEGFKRVENHIEIVWL